jgi:hypothetical protein
MLGVHCLAILVEPVPAGEQRRFGTTIPELPPGTYTVHSTLRRSGDAGLPLPDAVVSVS